LFAMRKRCQRAIVPVCMCLGLVAASVQAGTSAPAFSLKPNVRLDWDTVYFDHEAQDHAHASELRRMWLGAAGRAGTLDYKIVADLEKLQRHVNRDGVNMRDLWLNQRIGPGTLMLGQFKQAYSLEGYTSSGVGSFIERTAAISALAPGYHKAVSWKMVSARSSLATSVWQMQKIGAPQFAGFGVGTRLTFTPLIEAEDVRHLGLSLAHEHHDHPGTDGAPALRIRPHIGAHLSKAMSQTLAAFSDGRSTNADKWSLEYARVHGAWSWQSEFSGGLLDDGTEEARLIAEYGALSWFVSGHSRRYDAASGRFSRVKNISLEAPAWELALRYEHIRGRQRDQEGLDHIDTSTSAWTLASNWYLRSDIRLMLNLVTSFDHDHIARSRSRNYELIARAQYDF